MRTRWLGVPAVAALLVVSLACGDARIELDPHDDVADLSDDEAVALCDDFVLQVCSNREYDFWCDTCHHDCDADLVPALMRDECDDQVSVGIVQGCADLAADEGLDAFDACELGGGCLFDVFDRLCD